MTSVLAASNIKHAKRGKGQPPNNHTLPTHTRMQQPSASPELDLIGASMGPASLTGRPLPGTPDIVIAVCIGLILLTSLLRLHAAHRCLASAVCKPLPDTHKVASELPASAVHNRQQHPGGGVVHPVQRQAGEFHRVDVSTLEEPLQSAFAQILSETQPWEEWDVLRVLQSRDHSLSAARDWLHNNRDWRKRSNLADVLCVDNNRFPGIRVQVSEPESSLVSLRMRKLAIGLV